MTLQDHTILAIDDTPSIRAFLRVSLEDEGVNFYEAATAQEGLTLCKKIHPDLVILDLGLPDQDGLDILPKIKTMHTENAPSIIVLTVRKGRETIEEAFNKGADSYLSKPFLVEDLLEVIEKELSN